MLAWQGRKLNFDQVAAAFGQVLKPQARVYRFLTVAGDDFWAHAILTRIEAAQVRKLMGARFGKVLVEDAPTVRFEPA